MALNYCLESYIWVVLRSQAPNTEQNKIGHTLMGLSLFFVHLL